MILTRHSEFTIVCFVQDGVTPLMAASGKGHATIVHVLLARDDVSINQQSVTGVAALHEASSAGHVAVVQALIERDDINVNLRNKVKLPPFTQKSQTHCFRDCCRT